ncbi:ATP-binding protein [Planctomycetota bacterium]
MLPHVTQPFVTTKHGVAGIGLGLFIASRIVHEQGGAIEFRSSPGGGTNVTIRLPVRELGNAPGEDARVEGVGLAP